MTATMTREETIASLRVMLRNLNAAVESNEWNLETARILGLAEDIGAWLDSRPPAHRAMRGSDVEAWIKRHRDEHRDSSGAFTDAWHAIDDLLDDYREHADCGTSLDHEVQGPHHEA